MTTREELHNLVDQLPEGTLDAAHQALIESLAEHDPVFKSMLKAPEDNEPTTPEEDQSAEEGWQGYLRGEYMPAEEAEREFLP